MKKLATLLALVFVSLGFSSCCSMFGLPAANSGAYTTETRQVKTCKYDIVTKEVYTSGTKGGKGGMVETIEERVPRYKTITKKKAVPCSKCVRYYCPKKDCCGTSSDSFLKMAQTQGPVGSPHMGLVPTMRTLAP